jgi:ABC-type phosphate/phosphonate transport system permease subunit
MWSEELFNSLNAQLFKLGITPLITLIQIAWAASAACDFLALRLCLFSASQHW